jgi:hypothetical protein
MIGIKLIKAAALALASLLVAAGGYLAHMGVATVRVEQSGPDGARILVPFPMAVARVALAVTPEEELRELRSEVGPWAPALVRIAGELEDAPDALLVEFVDENDTVVIRKEGRKLVVEWAGPEEAVRVKVPLRSLASLAEVALGPGTI